MTKTLALSRKCMYRAKIFAGIIPINPVDSGVAAAENLPPLVCLTGKFFFFLSSSMLKHFFPPSLLTHSICFTIFSLLRLCQRFAVSSHTAGQKGSSGLSSARGFLMHRIRLWCKKKCISSEFTYFRSVVDLLLETSYALGILVTYGLTQGKFLFKAHPFIRLKAKEGIDLWIWDTWWGNSSLCSCFCILEVLLPRSSLRGTAGAAAAHPGH